MKLWLEERARIGAQIAAQSREIIDLHDNQKSAALYCFFGLVCNCAALHSSRQFRPAAG